MRKTIFVLSLLVFVLFACKETANVQVSSEIKQDLKLVPVESSVLFYCDYSKISDSDLARDFIPFFEENIHKDTDDEEFEQFKEFTNFNPQKDFESILVVVDRIESRHSNPKIIIHGKFDEDRIMEYVRKKAEEQDEDIPWVEQDIAGHTVYVAQERDQDFGFSFAGNKKIYLGNLTWIKDVLQGKTFSSDEQVARLHESIQYGSQLWISANSLQVNQSQPFSHVIENFPLSEKIVALTFSAQADEGIKFSGEIACDTPETGELMVDMMKGALAAAKLQVYKDRDAVDALNSIKMKAEGKRVLLNGKLDETFFDKLNEHRMLPWKRGHRRTI